MQRCLDCLINAITPTSVYESFPSSYSPPPTDKDVIMYQLHPIKQHIYHQNEQLEGMNNIYGNKNAFSVTLPSLISNKITNCTSLDSGCH